VVGPALAGNPVAASFPNAYLQVRPDNRVTVVCGSSEIRREVRTVIAMLLAGDLDAEWGKVCFEQASLDQASNNPMLRMQAKRQRSLPIDTTALKRI